MSKQIFNLPDLGEGLTEATLIEWLVAVGDTVEIDQVIAEVETKKSIVELPSPFAGEILALHGEAGETIATGSPILEVSGGTETGGAETGSANTRTDTTELEAYRREERAGAIASEADSASSSSEGSSSESSGNVLIGYGTGAGPEKRRRRRKGAAATSAPITASSGPIAVRSPIVRRLAKDLNVDLRSVKATGLDGAITRADVLAAQSSVTTPSASSTGQPTDDTLQVVKEEPFSLLRKAVSEKMVTSRSEIPEATVWVDVDITDLWNLRRQMGSPSFTAIFARFALIALEEYPLLASRIGANGDSLLTFNGVNLGLAVDTPRGLLVPKVDFADRLNIGELDSSIRALGEEARSGKMAPAKLSGSTFTLNNYGALGVDGSAAIINHPEVAILGVGRIIEKPWVYEGEIVARRIVQLSLVFDHRVCDGGYAAGFLNTIVGLLENPLGAYLRV